MEDDAFFCFKTINLCLPDDTVILPFSEIWVCNNLENLLVNFELHFTDACVLSCANFMNINMFLFGQINLVV